MQLYESVRVEVGIARVHRCNAFIASYSHLPTDIDTLQHTTLHYTTLHYAILHYNLRTQPYHRK